MSIEDQQESRVVMSIEEQKYILDKLLGQDVIIL